MVQWSRHTLRQVNEAGKRSIDRAAVVRTQGGAVSWTKMKMKSGIPLELPNVDALVFSPEVAAGRLEPDRSCCSLEQASDNTTVEGRQHGGETFEDASLLCDVQCGMVSGLPLCTPLRKWTTDTFFPPSVSPQSFMRPWHAFLAVPSRSSVNFPGGALTSQTLQIALC